MTSDQKTFCSLLGFHFRCILIIFFWLPKWIFLYWFSSWDLTDFSYIFLFFCLGFSGCLALGFWSLCLTKCSLCDFFQMYVERKIRVYCCFFLVSICNFFLWKTILFLVKEEWISLMYEMPFILYSVHDPTLWLG